MRYSKSRSSRSQIFFRIDVLNISQISQENTCESQAWNYIRKSLQHRCFLVKFSNFLRSNRLEMFCKKVFLKILRNSQEGSCARVSFLIKGTFFNRTPPVAASENPKWFQFPVRSKILHYSPFTAHKKLNSRFHTCKATNYKDNSLTILEAHMRKERSLQSFEESMKNDPSRKCCLWSRWFTVFFTSF